MQVKIPIDPGNRASISAEDGDNSLLGQTAADNEAQRIESWTQPSFANRGRHQAQLDPSYGVRSRRTGR